MCADEKTRRLPPRPEPLTESERRLHSLGRGTFLSLWSYPGVFKDQGSGGGRTGGKEICDLLVVFERDVLIFSDKTCAFPATGDLDLDWRRWYDRAITKSARQVKGAERWLRDHPDRVFIDRACKYHFPYPLPAQEDARYHRIVVAGGASQRCVEEFHGSGSLMIRVGEDASSDPPSPFTLRPLVDGGDVVHVFDDMTMALALQVFDTISDFVAYLVAKEGLIRSGMTVWAAGEEDLVARYVRSLDPSGRHSFGIPPKFDGALIEEGAWLGVLSNPQWAAKRAADRISYLWDEIIEKFTHFATRGESEFANYVDLGDFERGIRFMARESRMKRRLLSEALVGVMKKPKEGLERATRVMFPIETGDPFYVFLALRRPPSIGLEKYRTGRRALLEALVMAVRARWPEATDIVGLATEPINSRERSEDLLYLDGSEWSPELQLEAEDTAANLGLLTKLRLRQGHDKEFPDLPGGAPEPLRNKQMDLGRNDPCPCRSGRKFKKCCGHPSGKGN
ncbi:MAG: SEC-C metal-binding domain-containing protein [Longimicrobiales bacterium]